jgi:hypothetical protein
MDSGNVKMGLLATTIFTTLVNIKSFVRLGKYSFDTNEFSFDSTMVVLYKLFGDEAEKWYLGAGIGMDLSLNLDLAVQLIESEKTDLYGHIGGYLSPKDKGFYVGVGVEF